MALKVAVVTGSNKGIGFATVRGLCKRFDGVVYLTSRDVGRGKKAVEELNKEGLKPEYHQLDVTDQKSLETFRDHIKSKYEGIDVLINNAAIAYKHAATEPVAVQAEDTLRINYFSLLNTCDILFPLLKNGARVVNLSSSLGHLSSIPSLELRKKFKDENLTIPELNKLLQSYVDAAKQGTQLEEWGDSSYAVSKVGVSALSNIQQRLLASRNIKVNSVHPGYVDTELTSHKGPLTIDEGAVAPLYLALDADDSIQGKFVWYNKEVVDWDGKRAAEHYS
ncbi:carbonyl reductase [NADPH] 1-like [Anticarsia gemmatalis]|uniref:carbonyl reductase [NADPH] 1-like n=1 Tax=Anticarsia gemmatalis TaxID=129554 RepID=UPI003F76F7C6